MNRIELYARSMIAPLRISSPLTRTYATRILSYMLAQPKCNVPNVDSLPRLLGIRKIYFEKALRTLQEGRLIEIYYWEEADATRQNDPRSPESSKG